MKPILIIAVIIGVCLAVAPTDFSVHIKGKFLCHEEPLKNSPMNIYSENKHFNYEDFMDRYTDDNGEFSIKAWLNTDAYMITPYVVIKHRCWESKEVPQRCFRKIIQPISPPNVTTHSQIPDEKRTFDFGTIDLQFKHPAEVVVKCGK